MAFLGFYIIVFSFLRQVITEMGVRPLGVRLGIRGRSKSARFNEQGYAFCTFFLVFEFGEVAKGEVDRLFSL